MYGVGNNGVQLGVCWERGNKHFQMSRLLFAILVGYLPQFSHYNELVFLAGSSNWNTILFLKQNYNTIVKKLNINKKLLDVFNANMDSIDMNFSNILDLDYKAILNHCRMTNILQFIREWFYLCHNVNLHSNRTSKSKIYITTSIIGRPVCIILNVYMYISNMYERGKIWHTKLLVFN